MKILLQTTIPNFSDDWNIFRFSKLHACLERSGFDVTSRNKEKGDALLERIEQTDFDQMWLIAVDTGGALSTVECDSITRFRQIRSRPSGDPRPSGPRLVPLHDRRNR